VSLHDCLAAFFSADELKGDNMYSCGTCKKLRNGTKVSRVLELPEVMCIHLKRFRHEYLGSSKISTRVSFPLENIDMGPYLHKDCNSQVTNYRLVGVICHLGSSLGGGHYVSYCASPSNKWYEFDDRVVTKVPVETVANVEAYVLLYQKHDVMSFLKRERIIQMLNQSLREMDLMHFYVSKEWLVKFNTCAEPGPIDNGDFLCPHGSVWPHRADRVNDLCVELPQIVWEELQKTYGGGPACNRLQLCRVCEEWQARIRKRQANELDRYQELYEEFMETETSTYAISQSWFRQWQAFVRGRMFDIPGPIDNKHVSKSLTNRQSHRGSYRNDYVQVSENMWNWFHDLYGGGPAVLLREVQQKQSADEAEGEDEYDGCPEEEGADVDRGDDL
jgi:ubiquitin carboxyl-terminal hydrolase 20/33